MALIPSQISGILRPVLLTQTCKVDYDASVSFAGEIRGPIQILTEVAYAKVATQAVTVESLLHNFLTVVMIIINNY